MHKNASKSVLSWGEIDQKGGVSVVVSLFNYAKYIEECLNSIAAQDFLELQLVVVDDCSQCDNSLVVAQEWMERHKARFPAGALLSHRANLGLAEARNTAFQYAACDAVFVIDADNVIYPSCIRKLKRAMDAIDGDAAYSQLVRFGDVTETGYSDYWSKAFLADGPYIDAMALVHKRIWSRVGGYTHLEGGWEDYDFWCKAMEQGAQVCFVPEFLCKYRVHGNSMLHTDTAKSYTRLLNLISMRHPWTFLK